MKLFQTTCEFNYPWEQVTAANWRKYPNDISTHVIAVDVLRRQLNTQGTTLTTERLITVRQSVPKWIMMLIGGTNISYVREISTVDLENKVLTLRSCNLTYSHILRVYEIVKYKPHPDAPLTKTIFEQEAQITAYSGFTKVCNKLEEWSVQRFHDNAIKGRQGFESVLKVFSEHWHQKEKFVDELGSSIKDKVDGLENLIKQRNNH